MPETNIIWHLYFIDFQESQSLDCLVRNIEIRGE